MLPGDRAVLDGFRRGDPAALTRVYREYSPLLARFLARTFSVRGGSASSAFRLSALDLQDAHQESFVRAFAERNRKAYDGLRPFEGWLFSIGRSAAIDLLRAKGKVANEAVSLDEGNLPEVGSDDKGPEDQALEHEIRALVQRFLATLDGQARRLAELRFAEGRSQEQASAELGLTRSEVRTREKRVREAFAGFLEASGWEGARGESARAALAVLLLMLGAAGYAHRQGGSPAPYGDRSDPGVFDALV